MGVRKGTIPANGISTSASVAAGYWDEVQRIGPPKPYGD